MQINANAISRGRLGITGLLAILLALTYLAAAVKLVSSRCEDFAAKLLVDDALYYIVPAQHLLRGEGYSFDGVVRSSGVQPLWAILSAGLTALVSDSDLLVRALSLLSAVLWIGAGVLLYLGLRPICGWTALLAFSGFVFSGFSAQLAFIGMENGLHGLLYSCLLLVGFRWFYAPKANSDLDAQSWQLPAWRWLILGVLLALFTLARIDSGLAALLVGLMIMTGLVSGSRTARLQLSLRNAVLLAFPGVLMVGGWLLFSKAYFDTWTPISGQIKLLHYSDRSIDFSAAPRLILSNAERIFGLAFETVTAEASANVRSAKLRWLIRSLPLVLLCTGAAATVFHLLRGIRQRASWSWYFLALLAFVVIRFCFYSVRLPAFSSYCTWYFSPEIMTAWTMVAIGAVTVATLPAYLIAAAPRAGWGARGAPWVVGITAVVMIYANLAMIWRPPWGALYPSVSAQVAHWLQARMPAQRRIGTFSSGRIAYYASAHEVINLDGLMNDREFFEKYLRPGRLNEYLEKRQVEYLVDYIPADLYRDPSAGVFGMDAGSFELVRWWPMNEQLWYCVWRVSAAAPAGWTAPIDQISRIQHAAVVLGCYELVREEDLIWRQDSTSGGKSVVCSYNVPISDWLQHVLVTDEERRQLNLLEESVEIQQYSNVLFGNALELVGTSLNRSSVSRGQRLVLTRFWKMHQPTTLHAVELKLWISASAPSDPEAAEAREGLLHLTTGCHETYPVSRWTDGEFVVETYSLEIPRSMKTGRNSIFQAVFDEDAGWLAPDRAAAPGEPAALIGQVEIR